MWDIKVINDIETTRCYSVRVGAVEEEKSEKWKTYEVYEEYGMETNENRSNRILRRK